MSNNNYLPISGAPRDGSVVFVFDDQQIAKAKWIGGKRGMWAYPEVNHQIEFEPLYWALTPDDFFRPLPPDLINSGWQNNANT